MKDKGQRTEDKGGNRHPLSFVLRLTSSNNEKGKPMKKLTCLALLAAGALAARAATCYSVPDEYKSGL